MPEKTPVLDDPPRPPAPRVNHYITLGIWGIGFTVTAFTANGWGDYSFMILCAAVMVYVGLLLAGYDARVRQYRDERARWERRSIFIVQAHKEDQ